MPACATRTASGCGVETRYFGFTREEPPATLFMPDSRVDETRMTVDGRVR
jgi:hypothetical protein